MQAEAMAAIAFTVELCLDLNCLHNTEIRARYLLEEGGGNANFSKI
ncbi:MAG: hypothetical protein HC849_30135 [Oscillatoriales cyanobacterium RU_3_3]|nr:hypothetical protein [Oscillatoriales cyanobacterium RU_3_3]